MNKSAISFLICPTCKAHNLEVEKYLFSNEEIQEGRLICGSCPSWFRIENGIVDLLPLNLRRNDLHLKFAGRHNLKAAMPEVLENQDGKSSQIKYFKEENNLIEYEELVSGNNYYRALDNITIFDWMKRNLKQGEKVLDLGCGAGRQCVPLAENRIYTIGIDISEEMLLRAKKKADDSNLNKYLDLIVGDAENPPVKDNCFDACYLYGSLHHMPNKQTVVRNSANKLVLNGKYYSLEPNNSPLRPIFDFLMNIWKLYNEEASDSPLISGKEFLSWFSDSGIEGNIRYSTYFPPHFFILNNLKLNSAFLRLTDQVFNRINFMKSLGGAIIFEGVRTA